MNATPNLGLTHIETNQAQKEITANTFADGLDNAIAGFFEIPVSDSDIVLNNIQARSAILKFSGKLINNINVIIPISSSNKKFIIHNATTGMFTLTIKHESSSGIILRQSERQWIYSNGSEIYLLVKNIYPRLKTVSFDNPLILDWSDSDTIFVQLIDDTIVQHINAVAGQKLNLVVHQDTIGSHLITWGSEVRFGTDIPDITLTTDPNKTDKISFIFNDDNASFYDVISLLKGY